MGAAQTEKGFFQNKTRGVSGGFKALVGFTKLAVGLYKRFIRETAGFLDELIGRIGIFR